MGPALSTNREARVLMLGLDAAEKTSLLYRLKLGRQTDTIPTIGFNVETVQCEDTVFTIWDVGAGDKIHHWQLWYHYMQNADVIIFVVDTVGNRMDEAKTELHEYIIQRPESAGMPLLVLANKQDLPDAISAAKLVDALGLCALKRPWHIIRTSAVTGEGLEQWLSWMRDRGLHFRRDGKTQTLTSR